MTTALRHPSAERPLRTVPKPEPTADCTAWLRQKLASGPVWLGPLPAEWMETARISHQAAVEQFLAAQQAIGAVGEWDEQRQRFVLRPREQREGQAV